MTHLSLPIHTQFEVLNENRVQSHPASDSLGLSEWINVVTAG